LAIGVDISKEGINSAAMDYPNAIWCVSDIANCPFANNQFNFILNILSPANYSEFQRMISDDGMVIKVIPESDYLKELRDILYEGTNKQDYSNDNTLDVFRGNFVLTDVERVRYSFPLNKTLIEPLLHVGRSVTYPPGDPKYTFENMADDAIHVLDAYGIGNAHFAECLWVGLHFGK
jgi:23S rRNA (guanine745-N1)-methyltransferase